MSLFIYFFRYEKIWYNCWRWPSRGIATYEDIIETSQYISILPISTIHLKTPNKDWQYVTSSSNSSPETSHSGWYPFVKSEFVPELKISLFVLRWFSTFWIASCIYWLELIAQTTTSFGNWAFDILAPK